jgi:hypothetical protein
MKPDRYEPSPAGRRRLTGTIEQRGSKMGLPTWGGWFFGILIVGIGTAIMLVGTKVLPVNPASVHAPYWVLTVAGVSFLTAGLVVSSLAWRQFAANCRRAKALREHPDEPALADYRWHPDGFEVFGWGGAAKALALAIGVTVFLSILNWRAFTAPSPPLFKGVVILFDACVLLLWWLAGRKVGQAFKFGGSRIAFTRFPYRVSEPVNLRWLPNRGISRINKGNFTLRCVEEWTETHGTGKNRSTTLVHEEIWSGTWVLAEPRNLQLGDAIELGFELPAHAPSTQLNANKPLYWELEVTLDLPGLDFQESYLVPIYGSKPSDVLKPMAVNAGFRSDAQNC